MENDNPILPAHTTVSVRHANGRELVELTEPNWKVARPLIGRLVEQLARLHKISGELDYVAVITALTSSLPTEIVTAASGKPEEWLDGVKIGDVPKLLGAALDVLIHPDMIQDIKKAVETIRRKMDSKGTSETP